jgi:predicted GTPase
MGRGPLKPDCRKQLRDDLKFLNYAPIVFISAKSGKGTEKNLSAAGTGRRGAPQAHSYHRR